jgi:hypothetical protein
MLKLQIFSASQVPATTSIAIAETEWTRPQFISVCQTDACAMPSLSRLHQAPITIVPREESLARAYDEILYSGVATRSGDY